jgi:hypothetical protein
MWPFKKKSDPYFNCFVYGCAESSQCFYAENKEVKACKKHADKLKDPIRPFIRKIANEIDNDRCEGWDKIILQKNNSIIIEKSYVFFGSTCVEIFFPGIESERLFNCDENIYLSEIISKYQNRIELKKIEKRMEEMDAIIKEIEGWE